MNRDMNSFVDWNNQYFIPKFVFELSELSVKSPISSSLCNLTDGFGMCMKMQAGLVSSS